jgi:hypothetical protein
MHGSTTQRPGYASIPGSNACNDTMPARRSVATWNLGTAALQANLGLRKAKQCEDFLALASWLSMKEPGLTTNVMRSQLSRLYGQLYALQVRSLPVVHRSRADG